MELHVLGADGGELLGYHSCGFLCDGQLLIDAGTVCSVLTLEEILQIDHVLISHTHLDHIKELGLMADLLMEKRKTPLRIYGSQSVIKTLKTHYFNDLIWPDFTKIPHRGTPVIELLELQPLKKIQLGPFQVLPIPVNHTVETTGFLISWKGGSFLYSSDTNTTEELWKIANAQDDLKWLLLDVAFPNRLQHIADLAGHLTAAMAKKELAKLHRKVNIAFYHLKPTFYQEVVADLKAVFDFEVRLLVSGEKITL